MAFRSGEAPWSAHPLIPAEHVEHARRVFHDQEVSPQTGAPFGMKRELLLSPLGLPCTPPPWGVLAAVGLASGEIVWRTVLGGVYGVRLGLSSVGGPIRDGGWSRLHRRHADGRRAACLRCGDGRVAVAGATARRGAGHTDKVRVGTTVTPTTQCASGAWKLRRSRLFVSCLIPTQG